MAVIIVTGDRGAGKTTFCARVIELARSGGKSIGGVLSPAVFEHSEKIGIDAVDLKTNERRRLADRFDPAHHGPSTRRWSFHADTIEWGNIILQSAAPCDVLIVDELGTLEFDRGAGWIAGLTTLDAGNYRLGVVVIRRELLAAAVQRWPQARVIEIEAVDRARAEADQFWRTFK